MYLYVNLINRFYTSTSIQLLKIQSPQSSCFLKVAVLGLLRHLISSVHLIQMVHLCARLEQPVLPIFVESTGSKV